MAKPIELKDDWRQWAEFLEKTNFDQRKHFLGNKEQGYCCLGLRCLMHKVAFESFGKMLPADFDDANPQLVEETASFWNDNRDLTFKQIAAKIREEAADRGWK